MHKRQCEICLEYKNEYEFCRSKKKSLRKNRCKKCHAELTRASRYSMTVAELREYLRAAGDVCEICGIAGASVKQGLYIDHDHALDTTRGLLCPNCNYLIGHAADSVLILNKAAEYIKKYKCRDVRIAIGEALSDG